MRGFLARWVFGRTGGMRHAMLSWPAALLLVLGLHVGSGLLLKDLRFNNAPEVYYTPGSPAVKLRDELRRTFPYDEVLTVLFQGEGLYEPDFLRRLHRAAETLGRHPLVDRVSTVTTHERIAGSEDGFEIQRLIDPKKLGGAGDAEALRQRVLGDRFAPGALAARDGRSLALVVRPKPMQDSAQRVALTLATAAAIDEAGLRPWFAGDAGPVSMDVAQLDSILSDTAWLVPLTAAIGLALLAWVVGRWRPVLIGAVAMSTVALPTVAGLVLAGRPYTMATAILPSLLAAYTVANLLHLYAAFQQAQRCPGSRDAWLDRAFAETRKPSLFNVLTTVAGLLSLVLVPIPPIQDFGVAGAAGTVLVFLTVHYLVPPFLRHWDRRPWPQRGSGLGRLATVSRRGALFSMRHPKAVLLSIAALLLALSPPLLNLRVETDLLAYFGPDHRVRVDTARVEQALGGVTPLEISLKGDKRDTFQSVEVLRQVRALQAWLEQQPEVSRAASMAELVEEMHWGMHQEQPAYRALPGSDKLLRQYLLVYDGQDLYELVNRDFDHARIVLGLNVHGTEAIGEVIARIRARIAAEPIAGVKAEVGGYGRMLVDQVDLLVRGQLNSFAGAFAQMFLMMALLWRSFRAAALCMLPNLAPLYFFFVLMGAAGIALDSATVMIASVVLGITVDDTIHLYHGYQARLKKGLSPVFALARSYEASGRAVLATQVVLVAQFLLLTLSDFIPTANFGLVTAVGLVSGVLFEFMLPALIVIFDGRRPARQRSRQQRSPRPAAPPLAQPAGRPGAGHAAPDAVAPTGRHVLVCHGDACKHGGGAARVWRQLRELKAASETLDTVTATRLTKTSCLGPCRLAPVVQVYPEGSVYGLLSREGLDRIFEEHVVNGRVVGDLALRPAAPAGVESGAGPPVPPAPAVTPAGAGR